MVVQAREQYLLDSKMEGLAEHPFFAEVIPSASIGTSLGESGDAETFLDSFSIQDHHYPPTSTSGSSSSSMSVALSVGEYEAMVNDSFGKGLQAYHQAAKARTSQAALVDYGIALEHFQTMKSQANCGLGQRTIKGLDVRQRPVHSSSATLYQALCLHAMGKTLIETNAAAALALLDQALESLERVLMDCEDTSERLEGSSFHAAPPPCCTLDACMVEILHLKASAVMLTIAKQPDHTQLIQVEDALECTVQALRFLLDVRHFDQTRYLPCAAPSFSYECLSIAKHTQLLVETIEQMIRQYECQQTLGKKCDDNHFDRNYGRPTQEPAWVQRVEQALHVLQTRQYELTKSQKMAMASIQKALSHVYFQLVDLERASHALTDACDWLQGEQENPPEDWLDQLELFGSLLEQEASAEVASIDDPNLIDVDVAAALDLAMACFEKSLLLRNQRRLSLASQNVVDTHQDVAIANSLSHVARVMQLQGNEEGSLDLFRAAQSIYAKQTDYAILESAAKTALQHERWDQAVAILSQCVELAEAETTTDLTMRLDKTFIYFSLAEAYVGRGDYVSATMCLMESIKHDGQVTEPEIYALLQRVDFLRREEHRMNDESSFYDDSTENRSAFDADSSGDEEGTAFYDSESVSAFNPHVNSQNADGASEVPSSGVNLILDLSSLKDDGVAKDQDTYQAFDSLLNVSQDVTEKISFDEDSPPPPVVSPDTSFAEEYTNPSMSPASATHSPLITKNSSLDKASTHSAPNPIRRFGSPLRTKRDQGSVGDSSEKSGLAKVIANTLRLSIDRTKLPPGKIAKKKKGGESNDKEVMNLPSEEEFHVELDRTEFAGPLKYFNLPPTMSFDSDISSITMRMDDSNVSKDSGQDFWWGVSVEGLGRWLPTVVSSAVEAAEGFLSARAIHSQKKIAPLFDYASSDESGDENEESADLLSRPAIADSRTQRAVRGSRASRSGTKRIRASGGNYDSGALSIYSGQKPRLAKLVAEIGRYESLISEQEKKHGKNCMNRATSLFTLAVLYSQQGANGTDLAIEYAHEALRIQKDFGKIDDASRSLHFLADLYLHQKQYTKSLSYYTETLRLERDHYGELSEEAAKTLNRIGTLHSIQDDFFRAMECHQEALRIAQVAYGENLKHPLVSETLCQIGSVYYRERNAFTQSISGADKYTTFIESGMLETIGRAHEDRGSYKMAISFFEERLASLQSQETDLLLEEVAETLNSLGMLSFKAGRLLEALEYYEKSLRIQTRLGCDKTQMATIRVLIGSTHFQIGDWHHAIKILLEALEVLQDELGPEHETVAAAHYQLGVVQAGFFHLDDAMSSFSRAMRIQQRALGMNHPATLRTRREIGNLVSLKVSECDTALAHFDDILSAQRAIHGDRHPNIAETLFSIGRAYSRRGDFSSALQIFEETYQMRTEFLGHDVPAQAATLSEIALIHMKRQHLKRALQICDVVLTIREESLRDQHIDIALIKATKGRCFVAQNRLEDAENLFLEALEMGIRSVGDWHPSVAEIHLAASSLHLKRCHFEQARASVERALKICKRASLDDDDFPLYEEARKQLKRIEHDEALYV